MMKKLILSIVPLILIQMPNDEMQWDNMFSQRVELWIEQIAQSEPTLSHWKNGTWYANALGPNSKQWLITIHHQEKVDGYLIIGVDSTNQPVLLDYGSGSFSLD